MPWKGPEELMDWGDTFWVVVGLVIAFVIGIATIDGLKEHLKIVPLADSTEDAVPFRPVYTPASDENASPGYGIEVPMPQMGESITEGILTKWLKKVGEPVARDEPLFEISTDKVDAEIPSPTSGILGEIKVKEGARVRIGSTVCIIGGTIVRDAEVEIPQPQEEDVRFVILEVSRRCSAKELRAAYHRQASLWHPDKVAHLAPELQAYAKTRMTLINDAYESLSREYKSGVGWED